MPRRVLAYIVILLATFVLYKVAFKPVQNDVAPKFEARRVDDDSLFVLSENLGKKVVLVNFWATWCPPCRDEVPLLNELFAQLPAEKFALVALMQDDAIGDGERRRILENFNKKVPVNFPVYSDPNGMIADAFGTHQLPESYLIGLNGRVIYKHDGAISKWQLKQVVELIEKELAAKAVQ